MLALSPALWSIVVLVAGAAVVLLLVQPLSRSATAASAIGLVAVVLALVVGVAGERSILALGITALCGVAIVALLLVPGLDMQVSEQVPEVVALLLLGTAGALALAASTTLVEAIVGQETLALAAVTLVALSRGAAPLEAAFKYFTLGALALAALIYGLGLVYLGTGSLGFPIAQALSGNLIVVAGAALLAVGFAFEMAVFPFQWGAIDAYSAASPGLAGFIMSTSKVGAAFALGKLIVAAGVPINGLLIWLGCLTIIWGTFGAIAQRDFRRMMAYSAITHAGFIAVAVGSGPQGPTTAVYYAAIYSAMAMLVFASISAFGNVALPIDGLGRLGMGAGRASALMLGLFSMGGVPPTPGFWAKLAVIEVAWQSAGWLPAAIVAAGGVFSLLYYLRPVPDLFATIRSAVPEGELPFGLTRSRGAAIAAVVLAAAAVVVLGLLPGLAWNLAGGPTVGS
jgi:NADH-quinone oxidoreductase subunit N